MRNEKITVAIPARNEKYLIQTCQNFIDKAVWPKNIEVVVVLDGWDSDYQRYKDEFLKWSRTLQNIKIIEHDKPLGVRVAANKVAAIAEGFYFFKMDSHCDITFAWDTNLINAVEACGPNTLVIPDMVSYDPETGSWGDRRMNHCYLRPDCTKTYWPNYDYSKVKDKVERFCPRLVNVDTEKYEPMLCNVGAAWFSRTDFWWLFNGHDESMYMWGESGPETSLKTWLSGGQQVLDRSVCFAHYFRKKFPYKLNGNAVVRNKRNSYAKYACADWPAKRKGFKELIEAFAPVPEWRTDE